MMKQSPAVHYMLHSTGDTFLLVHQKLLAMYLLKLVFSPSHSSLAAKLNYNTVNNKRPRLQGLRVLGNKSATNRKNIRKI